MFNQMENSQLQGLHFRSDPQTGLQAIVAIHSTARGPALGGCRFISYASSDDAITDAIRLARGMSYKAALAGLPLGGGKSVIIRPQKAFDRQRLMESFGRFVNDLGGRYITAMDSGTQISDMDAIARHTSFVTCTRESGDPAPYTARGVFEGIKASVKHKFRKDDLKGVHVTIQGLGNVGYEVARLLHKVGAELTVTDIDEQKILSAEQEFGASRVEPGKVYEVETDVFCPCGLGAIINPETVELLRCAVIAGSANNQLSNDAIGERLLERDILYAPDYLINAGGLIFVYMRYSNGSPEAIARKVDHIGPALGRLFNQASGYGLPTNVIANQRAEQIIANSIHEVRANQAA